MGQALINVYKRIGAPIIATTGTPEKKEFLIQTFGIPESKIFSRDTSFEHGIMRLTGGKGVDVIMNSVVGELLKRTWNCIAPFGRFIELGKADIADNSWLEMKMFAKNVTFSAFGLVVYPRAGQRNWVIHLLKSWI